MDTKFATDSVGASGSARSGGTGASGSAGTTEGAWWRWTHGKSGSISSSSAGSGHHSSTSGSISSASHATSGDANISSAGVPIWETMRWQKRTTRTGLVVREDASFLGSVNGASTSPKVYSSSSTRPLSSSSALTRKKVGLSTPRSSRDSLVKKRVTSSPAGAGTFHSSSATTPSRDSKVSTAHSTSSERLLHNEIKWTTAPMKRKVTRKEKKLVRTPLHVSRPPAAATSRSSARLWLDDLRDSDDIDMLEAKSAAPPLSPTSSVSTASTSSSSLSASFASSSFSHPDPLVTCARAVLQDCIRQRCLQSGGMRKRTVEGRTKAEVAKDSKLCPYHGCAQKPCEGSGFSCGCSGSSSSDDELSQLSSIEMKSRMSGDTGDQDAECKLTREELYRQLMLGDYDVSSSPEFESLSPLFEERRGLPVEIRYQLPLALGTANETNKECPICQIRYGIGDHIVTLPCQHFFHACCVDKWLWNHTSCPLCRTEVTLDIPSDQGALKHQFNECSQSDQDVIRRQLRSSSHSAGFRPVVPVNAELEQLQSEIASMSITQHCSETSQVKYLVCPKPQRTNPK
ncbi:hypothetical protein PINS_up000183 [Pythium insidiosum]|nr:hypothetical protein PINS_up000183 [Pythium insidiosum]